MPSFYPHAAPAPVSSVFKQQDCALGASLAGARSLEFLGAGKGVNIISKGGVQGYMGVGPEMVKTQS